MRRTHLYGERILWNAFCIFLVLSEGQLIRYNTNAFQMGRGGMLELGHWDMVKRCIPIYCRGFP